MEKEVFSFNKLSQIVNLTFIGNSKQIRMNFDISELLQEPKIVDDLLFNSVSLNLLKYPTDKSQIQINKLIFTNDTKIDEIKQFEKIDLSKILIEYANIKMFKEFQDLSSNTEKVEEITITSKDVKSIEINSDEIKYIDQESSAFEISIAKTINLKVENDLKLNVDETSTNKNGVVNFEFIHEDNTEPQIDIQCESFNDDFSFGVSINRNKASINFQNTNILPVEIKGSGNLKINVKEGSEEIKIKQPITVLGELLLYVLDSLKSIEVPTISIKESNNKNLIGAPKLKSNTLTLLSDESYSQINLEQLNIEARTKSEIISSNISKSITIGNEAEVTFSNNFAVTCPIEISYGIKNNSNFTTFINFGGNSDNFNPTYIILKNIETNEKDFNIIKSSQDKFSLEKCESISSIVKTDKNAQMFIYCTSADNYVTLEASSKFRSFDIEEDSSLKAGAIVGITVACLVIAVAVVLVIFITFRKKKQESLDNSNQEEDEPDVSVL